MTLVIAGLGDGCGHHRGMSLSRRVHVSKNFAELIPDDAIGAAPVRRVVRRRMPNARVVRVPAAPQGSSDVPTSLVSVVPRQEDVKVRIKLVVKFLKVIVEVIAFQKAVEVVREERV